MIVKVYLNAEDFKKIKPKSFTMEPVTRQGLTGVISSMPSRKGKEYTQEEVIQGLKEKKCKVWIWFNPVKILKRLENEES